MFLLLPVVTLGLFIINLNKGSEIKAVDPLIVTYNGSSPPNPMFVVTNLLPGDEVEKTFSVKNGSGNPVTVTMDSVKINELKSFASILDIEILEEPSTSLFNGKLTVFFAAPPLSLGTLAADASKSFRIKVKFPFSSGNEYQGAKVVFNILWKSDTSTAIELPEECKLLEGKITSILEGTEGNDKIKGTPANELILGKGGDDTVDGKSGDDCIIGGSGNDKIDSGQGNDIVVGGIGNDKIEAGSGDDIVYGNEGADGINGAAGNDTIYGNEGDDELEGGSGNDAISGGQGNDKIEGGSGPDVITGDDGNDEIWGGSGNDNLNGGNNTDKINGNAGTDTCTFGEVLASCEL